jgi:hypothetical protein
MNALGQLKYFIGDNAKIEVIGFKNQNNDDWIFDRNTINDTFKPNGNVFEPGFKLNYSNIIQENIFEFEPELNSKSDGSGDLYKIKFKGLFHEYNYRIFQLDHLFLNPYFVDLDFLTSKIEANYKYFFYVNFENKYYGPFRVEKGNVIPKLGKEIKSYDKIDFFTTKSEIVVLKEPQRHISTFAGETDIQIQSWFKALIKESNHPVIKAIKENGDWKSVLNKLVSKDSEIDKHRLELAINDLDIIDLTLKEIESFSHISYPVQEVIQKKYNEYKEEIKKELSQQLKAIEAEKNEQINKLNQDIQILNTEKIEVLAKIENINIQQKENQQAHNSKLDQVKIEIEKSNGTLKYIEENKDKILRDLSIFSSIFPKNEINRPTQGVNKYQIKSNTNLQLEKKDSLEKINQSLKLLGYNAELNGLRETLMGLSSHQCILSDTLELPLAIIKTINNCTYYYANVEINWLSFQKLIDNGLLKAFEDAILNPKELHFFILRDINISSPECYARPLLDFNNKLLPELSSSVNFWPNNFKIIGIIQPFPEIGLPIIESTFKNWYGCKRNTISISNESNIEIPDSYLDIKLFYSLNSDDIENHLDEYF